MKNPETLDQLGVEERIMTALFTDITNFSTISAALTPQQLVHFLNEYLTEMGDVIEAHGGTIDKFEGDAIVAFFGAPVAYEDHALRACLACIDQQKRLVELRTRWKADKTLPLGLQELCDRWEAQGQIFLRVRMGLCAGPMVIGNMGSKKHPDYTMMGDTVNLAARFEGQLKIYNTGIMINDEMFKVVHDQVETRKLDMIQVIGKEEVVTAYEVLNRKGALHPEKYQVLELYNRGMGAFEAFQFAEAETFFHQALEIDPHDGPSALYVSRCKDFASAPPPDLIFRGDQVRMVSELEWMQQQQQRLEAQQQLIQEMEEELQTAHDLQMGLMPTERPQMDGYDISGHCIPANHVGGDFFQYFPLPEERLAICMADVSGHAMEAAVPVMMFSGILKSEMRHGHLLEQLYHDLNQTLYSTLEKRIFVCFAMGELDPKISTLRLANGGCPYPYHFRAATGEMVELRVDTYPLGIRPDTRYKVIETRLEPGDYVVFCSDGIIEAENSEGELFGFDRTAETIKRGCQEKFPAEQLLDFLIEELHAFTGDAPQRDDQTVVILGVEV